MILFTKEEDLNYRVEQAGWWTDLTSQQSLADIFGIVSSICLYQTMALSIT